MTAYGVTGGGSHKCFRKILDACESPPPPPPALPLPPLMPPSTPPTATCTSEEAELQTLNEVECRLRADEIDAQRAEEGRPPVTFTVMADMMSSWPGGPTNGGYGLCFYEVDQVRLLNPLGGYFTALCDSGSSNGGSGLNASAGEGCYCTVPAPDAPPPPGAPYDDHCTFNDAYAMGGVPKEACEAWASQFYPGMQYRVDPSMGTETHGICRFIRRLPHQVLTPSSAHYGFDRVEIMGAFAAYLVSLHPSNTDVCDPVGGPVGQAGECFCGFPPSAPPPPAVCDSDGAIAAQMTTEECYEVFVHLNQTYTGLDPMEYSSSTFDLAGVCYQVPTDDRVYFAAQFVSYVCNLAGATCHCSPPPSAPG